MEKTPKLPDTSVLVTGCAGFIGHRLCEALLRLGVFVVGFDECNAFYDPSIKNKRVQKLLEHSNFTFIDDLIKVREKTLHTAFHLAAQANVRFCEDNPEETIRCNQSLTRYLLELMDPSTHIVFVSSSSVYGKAPTPWGAETIPEPQGAYGLSKLECEALVQQRGAPATIIRPFSIVGPGIRPDLAPSIFVDRIIHRDAIEIYGDGSASRDFTHVDDLVEALLNAIYARGTSTNVEVYPIGSGNPRSVNELVEIIKNETQRDANIIHSPAHRQEVSITFADNTKAIKELGFRPKGSLEKAVREVMLHPRPIEVLVVVATHHRETLLRTRSLPSIQRQTVPPNRVCVVVDEDVDSKNTDIDSLRRDFPEFHFIRNCRTKGASGAWNSGVMEITNLPEVQKYCYLAILDDDDMWEPDHVEKCLKEAQNGLTDWVISGIVRHEDGSSRKQTIPQNLQQEDFFVGNPHIQGSNLFLSLRLFYRAGMFDEFLTSCTDRDLCIRLFDVAKDLNIQATQAHTVHHFADSSILRLSSPGSNTKRLGVHRFAIKHARRMTEEQRRNYWMRAQDLFAITPADTISSAQQAKSFQTRMIDSVVPSATVRESLLWNEEVTSLLFGVISDKPEVVSGLISDIGEIPNSRLVLLANGHSPKPFEAVIRHHGVAGLVIHHDGERLSISEARTLVQIHCGKIWQQMISIDAVVIMDDDKRIQGSWYASLCSLLRRERPDGGFIGPDVNAPPLPAAFTARTSMVDLFYSRLGRSNESASGLEGEDLFYDLSARRTDHLEYPVQSMNIPAKPVESILKGIPISRKAEPNCYPQESTERGGCCVILDAELLVSHPNPRIVIGDVVTRRSDMMWVQLTHRTFIKDPALAVHHDRTKDKVPNVSSFLSTAYKDLLGSAMCRPPLLRSSFLRQRLKHLGANLLRIQGLEAALGISPQLHFCYQMWVSLVIQPASELLETLSSVPMPPPLPATKSVKADSFCTDFRKATAMQMLLQEFPYLRGIKLVGLGSEGVVLRSFCTPELKYKILDCYRPRAATFTGTIPGHWRNKGSTVLVSPYVTGEPYVGGEGPALVHLLREIQDSRLICFRNWKPENLVVNKEGVHFVDYGRDVVAFSTEEFKKMVHRAYLSWRFPKHGDELKRYCRKALTQHIPQLDAVGLMFDAINDRCPDADLYSLVNTKLQQIIPPGARILDFGAGKGKFQKHTGIQTVNYDPKVLFPGVISDISEVSGRFDAVLCVRVLCVLPPEEFIEVLNQVRRLVKRDSGRVIFAMCDPRGIKCDNPEVSFSYNKTVSTGRARPEWYRPLRVVRMEMIRVGFEILEEFVFWRVDHERFEKHPNQWCCVARVAARPRHTLLIKTCLMEHATITPRVQHLVETLPCGVKTILVLDCKREKFLRGYDSASESEFRKKTDELLRERWVDHLVEPPDRQQIAGIHEDWFGFTPDFSLCDWTHDETGVQYASTFHGFNNCETDFVLQVDSDLMVYCGDEIPKLPFTLFDEDPMALTWSLPIASHESKPYSTGHRFEVRGCLISIARLKQVFHNSQRRVVELLRSTHWYRIVDEIIGGFRSYRGGQQTPFFVHPQNNIKTDEDQYLLAIDAIQCGRLHPEQYGKVDWVGWPEGRGEPFVILVCGRNVPAGRMLRCIDSIIRNMVQSNDIGLVVIDDCSSRQSAAFLKDSLPRNNTTFVSRRKWAGYQANALLGCSKLCDNPMTVICMVDLDDALLGKPICMVRELYQNDPDLEVAFGGCVRVDKFVRYEIDDTRPVPPRLARGQPYWTHLRTFRKVLFDRIRVEDLGIGGSEFIIRSESPLGNDWAFSVPIWEQARKTKALKGDLYLFEPGTKPNRVKLDAEITKIMDLPPYSRRRYSVAIIGDSNVLRPEAYEVGLHLAKAGYIVITGGLCGVMEEACRGAKKAGGTTVGILPGTDPKAANPFVDLSIATGMDRHRNGIVALASAVVVVGGRAGTYSEVATAWSAKRLVISLKNVPGCSKEIAGKPFDNRPRYRDIPGDKVYGVEQAQDVVSLLESLLPLYQKLDSRL